MIIAQTNVNLEVTESGFDPGSSTYGCTDSEALNYNSLADIDDGSCIYSESVPNVLNFYAVYQTDPVGIYLYWQNPSWDNFDQVEILRKAGTIPANPTDGTLVYQGIGQSFIDLNFIPGNTYYYTAFVRSLSGNYSSGAITFAFVPANDPIPDDPIPDDPTPDDPIISDPFLNFPEVLLSDLEVDFIFWQEDEKRQSFRQGGEIRVNGRKNLTILTPYNRLPEVLKTIGMTIYDPENSSRSLSFLLRLNENETEYTATIGPLWRDGIFPFIIYVFNYEDQTIKKINGYLTVAGVGYTEPPLMEKLIEQALIPVFSGGGLVAGLTQTVIMTSRLSSLGDLYLILLKALAAVLGWLGIKKKSKPWGTVYDAVTKQPIDPAYVTVNQGEKEIASAITDIDGRYGFLLPGDTYTIKAQKTHYQFPSQILQGRSADELYNNLYFGKPLSVSAEEVINLNIPLDPTGFDWNEFAKTKDNFFKIHSAKEVRRKRILAAIFWFGFSASTVSFIYQPAFFSLLILIIYSGLLLWQRYRQAKHHPTNVKKSTGEPLPFSIVRVFLSDLDQEVKRLVADELGRVYLLVRPGQYYLTVEEKLADGSYRQVLKSEQLNLKKGVLESDIIIDA